jgi:prevent-host-death family protein
MKTINASEFKAKCLALLDEVAETGEHIMILKRGRPVAELVPPVSRDRRLPQESIMGTIEILGDVVQPALPSDAWEVLRDDDIPAKE